MILPCDNCDGRGYYMIREDGWKTLGKAICGYCNGTGIVNQPTEAPT